jgi:shikimate dehydrogenase
VKKIDKLSKSPSPQRGEGRGEGDQNLLGKNSYSSPSPNPLPAGERAFRGAVIGCPVGHSLSPLIHNYWIEKYGLKGRFDAREIQPEQLKDGLARLVEEGYTGFSVTIPHKQAVMDLCETIDETARCIGAVNCLAVGDDGAIDGLNTDWFGFVENIREAAPDFDFAALPALVLGAGGAARAIIYGLRRRGAAKILVANRTPGKAAPLAVDFGVEIVAWEDREEAAREVGLLVNTASAGMTGKPLLEFKAAALPKDALVCDIVYAPLQTALLRDAAARGNVTVEGLGMLLHQARPAFARWTGVMPDVTADLRGKLLERLAR